MDAKVKIEMCVELKDGESIDKFKPFKAHPSDAAFDLISAEETYFLKSGERKLFSAGFKMELPEGYEAQIRPRSGNAIKKGITVLNTPGTIDANYRGVVGVILINTNEKAFGLMGDFGGGVEIKRGDKIAQMVIQKLPDVSLKFSEVDKETDRGSDGFGSTDRK